MYNVGTVHVRYNFVGKDDVMYMYAKEVVPKKKEKEIH
jgi:hypothetical protein